MDWIKEAVRRENKLLIKQGKIEDIKEMLKRNMPIDLIADITHFSKAQIMKLAK